MRDIADKLFRDEQERMRELQAIARQINKTRRRREMRLLAALVILMAWLSVTGLALGAELAMQGRWWIIPGLAIVAPLAWAFGVVFNHFQS